MLAGRESSFTWRVASRRVATRVASRGRVARLGRVAGGCVPGRRRVARGRWVPAGRGRVSWGRVAPYEGERSDGSRADVMSAKLSSQPGM